MGIYGGGLQIIYSAIKVPMLLLVSLYVTVPSYYVLYSLLGGKRTTSQTVMLLLLGFTVISTVLIAFVPVNLFFLLTSPKSYETHNFTALLNIAIFTLGGFFALTYFVKGAETLYRGVFRELETSIHTRKHNPHVCWNSIGVGLTAILQLL